MGLFHGMLDAFIYVSLNEKSWRDGRATDFRYGDVGNCCHIKGARHGQ